nr:hypothetical protein [Chlamydiota bacterium]
MSIEYSTKDHKWVGGQLIDLYESHQEKQKTGLDKTKVGKSIYLLALGVFICIGALFCSLAAYQVLPGSINAISQLGTWGQVGSFTLLILGSGLFTIGL